jgi:hypothetical protein
LQNSIKINQTFVLLVTDDPASMGAFGISGVGSAMAVEKFIAVMFL